MFMKYYFYMRENLAIQRVDLFSVISMIFTIFLLLAECGENLIHYQLNKLLLI